MLMCWKIAFFFYVNRFIVPGFANLSAVEKKRLVYDENFGDKCLVFCIIGLASNTEKYKLENLEDKLLNYPFTLLTLSKNQFSEVCGYAIGPFGICLRNCSMTNVTLLTLASFSAPEFLCVEKHYFDDIYPNFDCLHEAQKESFAECEDKNGICFYLYEKVPRDFNIYLRTNDNENLKNFYLHYCEYYFCVVPCKKKFFDKICSSKISKFAVVDLMVSQIRTAEKAIVTIANEATWPAEQCNKLINYDGDNDGCMKQSSKFNIYLLLVLFLLFR